ncbi:MAG: hypothetical protein H6729_08245 [Deltaproteobacteria bacterium]|nr:hypothetical protein [Deltaproteobacteria bacterium]
MAKQSIRCSGQSAWDERAVRSDSVSLSVFARTLIAAIIAGSHSGACVRLGLDATTSEVDGSTGSPVDAASDDASANNGRDASSPDGEGSVELDAGNGEVDSGVHSVRPLTTFSWSGAPAIMDARALFVDHAGRYLVAGTIAVREGDLDVFVLRFDDTGTIDSTFNQQQPLIVDLGSKTDIARDVTEDASHRIVVVGETTPGADSDTFVMRRLENGAPDPSFASGNARFFSLGQTESRHEQRRPCRLRKSLEYPSQRPDAGGRRLLFCDLRTSSRSPRRIGYDLRHRR